MTECHHSAPLLKPKTRPHARDYAGPWCPICERRCADCGTAKGNVYQSGWGDTCCVGCAANRLGA